MHNPGRLAAAIEVMEAILQRHQPAADALKEWGRAHRFAGSGDRNVIGNLVYDGLRKRASCAALMGEDTPRAILLGVLKLTWALPLASIAAWACGEHGPGALTDEESQALEKDLPESLSLHQAGDIPEWLAPSFQRVFGEDALHQARSLAQRAPVDVRANTLKITEGKLLKALEKFKAIPGPLSPLCVRIPPPEADGRNPNVEAEPAHAKGWFEVQDAGSQLAALLSGAKPGEQVLDLCAGAGGKTLALAAMMQNKGQLFATDKDRHRLRPIFDRIKRAGAHNVQIIPADEPQKLDELQGRLDLVLVDAPCSGSGSWRRKPDAKWRMKPEAFANRQQEQRDILARAASLVKKGGRLVYITCSILAEENTDQLAAFLSQHTDFQVKPTAQAWADAGLFGTAPKSADGREDALLLTPANHHTDGFFISVMVRN